MAAGEPPAPPGRPARPVIASFAALRGHLREAYAVSQGFWAPGSQALAALSTGGLAQRPTEPGPAGAGAAPLPFPQSDRAQRLRHPTLDRTHIGRRLRIAHQHGLVIHSAAVIGDDCLIRHGVTIGGLAAVAPVARCRGPLARRPGRGGGWRGTGQANSDRGRRGDRSERGGDDSCSGRRHRRLLPAVAHRRSAPAQGPPRK